MKDSIPSDIKLRKNRKIEIRINERLKEEIKNLSNQHGMSMSKLIEEMIVRELKRHGREININVSMKK